MLLVGGCDIEAVWIFTRGNRLRISPKPEFWSTVEIRLHRNMTQRLVRFIGLVDLHLPKCCCRDTQLNSRSVYLYRDAMCVHSRDDAFSLLDIVSACLFYSMHMPCQ